MQNKPNPFSVNTEIEFYLPENVKKATLTVYDLRGKQVKSITVVEREYGSAVIYGSELQPGIYHYSLIADGEVIGIEKMILTD
jgi:myo-inositol-hexaphosphate 3-phosphohydrolase